MTAVARSYVDALGTERSAPPETVADFEAIVGRADAALAPATVARDGEPLAIEVTLPAATWTASVEWELLREDGSSERGSAALRDAAVTAVAQRDGTTYDTRRVVLDATAPLGLHRVRVRVASYVEGVVHVAVVPQHAWAPSGRSWGIALQLYTLRSERNDGIGDLADLRAVCRLLGDAGASYVGINPLHAAFRSDPEAASPYAASSRRWLNWLAIAIDDVPEATERSAAALAAQPDRLALRAQLREASHVNYTGVAAVKDALLRACFAALGHRRMRRRAFKEWCAAQGEPLRRFAVFEVLVATFGRDLAAWPAAYRDPAGAEVATFADGHADDVRYAMYLQWLAAEQLAAVARDAAEHGVRIYRDLAVGVDAGAADVWADAGAYVAGVSVGAPPDVLNTLGQDWGLPPLHPATLASDGFAGFLGLLQANCRDAGALRIDHAFSLARLYWIPRGAGAGAGTYVAYPLDALRGIVALASVRERCVVIGEDLGTVPEGFRERMEATGILAYRILFFERDLGGAFLPPESYPALALAASGTHDLATLPAWLQGDDLVLRDQLALLPVPLADAHAERAREREAFFRALVEHGDLAPGERDDETAVVVAANRYLAATPCAIVMAQLDDILGERMPVNVPGTSTEYPNWRRKLGTDVASLASDDRLRRLCTTLAAMRPRET